MQAEAALNVSGIKDSRNQEEQDGAFDNERRI